MEQLPYDIEQKLENLPVISFDNPDELQKIIASQDFLDILTYYEEHFMPEEFKKQQEVYKRIALYLTLTNQDVDLANQIDGIMYRRPVPSIEEFLSGKFYMYNSNATLYPYWRQQLEYMFKEGSPIKKTIFGGSIGCLTDDTVIATLNGDKTIKELLNNYKDEWVLSFNTENKSWEPDKIIDVFSSGIQDVYEITLDNNEIIKCTSDHRFLTRQNKWKSIDTGLCIGTSMMPYYYQISDKGYIQVKNNVTEKWEKRYLIVSKWKTSYKRGQVTYHKNFKKYDDRPSNLAVIPHRYHWEYHAKLGGRRWKEYNASIKGDEFKEYRRQKGLKAFNTYKARSDYDELEAKRKIAIINLCHNSEFQRNSANIFWNSEKGKEHKKEISKIITKYNKSDKGRNTSRKMAENMRNLKASKTKEELEIIHAKQALGSLARFKGKNSKEYKEKLAFIHTKEPWYDPTLSPKENHKRKKIYNHKIISIKYIGKQQVYDITTEKNHNFALKAGIIAHNCGKSTIARKAFLYVLYRILCLRNARAVFNIDQDATIANVIISMTLKQVYETNLLPFIKLMETMPCFQRVMRMQSFDNFDLSDSHCPIPFSVERSTGTIYFPDNIIITCGSGITHTIGLNIVNSFCFTGAMKVYTDKGVVTFKELVDRFNNGEKFKTLTLDSQGHRRITEITNALETTRTQDLIRIYYTDKDYIECTPTHPFVIKNPKLNDTNIKYENGIPYKQAQYLTEEDELYDSNTFYVYGLYIKGSDTPFYIGISSYTNVFEKDETKKYVRAYFHLKHPEQDNQRTHNILINNKVEVKILNENLSDVEAYKLEKQLIKKYGRIELDENGKLTNIAQCGNTVDPADIAYGVKCSVIHKEKSRCRLIEYNKSDEHRKKTAYYNSIRPKVSSAESKAKLAKSQHETWNKKPEIEKTKNNLSKSLGRAWNVLKRIDSIYINEQIFNTHRSKGSRLANTEPLWNSIVQKANGIENFLSLIKEKYGKEFIYED